MKPEFVYLVRLVKIANGVGGVPSVIGIFYDERAANDAARNLNAKEKDKAIWRFIVDCFRAQ